MAQMWQSDKASSKLLVAPTLLNGTIVRVRDGEKTTT